MSIRKVILTAALALVVLALSTTSSQAHFTRELTGTIGNSFEGPVGIAVDLETGNVYVINGNKNTLNIYGSNGGPPAGGVPSQITGQEFHAPNLPQGGHNGIAVDNSCYEQEPRLTESTTPTCKEFDPSYGDIYIPGVTKTEGYLRKFALNAQHEYEDVEEIPLEGPNVFGDARSASVDSRGNVYIATGHISEILEHKVSGERLEIGKNEIGESFTQSIEDVAAGDHGYLYISEMREFGDAGVVKLGLDANSKVISGEPFAGPFIGKEIYREVAVNRSTGDVLVGDGGRVAEYSEAGGEPLLEFGSSEPAGGGLVGESPVTAVAVNSDTDTAYVSNGSRGDVDVFGPVIGPPIVPGEQPGVSDVTRTSALLAGTADPEGGRGSYYYEYVPAGEYEPGAADPYVAGGRTASTALASAHADESIERVVLSGLLPGTTYHYRLAVINPGGTTYGPDQTFTTAPATPPTALTGPAVEVSATSASLTGTVGPRGLPTSYVFEVGTSTSYGGARLFGNAGDGTGEVEVTAGLQYLVPGTTYHYRLSATSFDGTTYGPDQTFATPSLLSLAIAQPASTPLIGTPTVQFPSIAGAITEPVKVASKSLTEVQKLKNALRVCRKKAKRPRVACEKQADRKYKKK